MLYWHVNYYQLEKFCNEIDDKYVITMDQLINLKDSQLLTIEAN